VRYIAWSGGYDSTYAVITAVLEGHEVQPWYIFEYGKEDHLSMSSPERHLIERDRLQLEKLKIIREKFKDKIKEPRIFYPKDLMQDSLKVRKTLDYHDAKRVYESIQNDELFIKPLSAKIDAKKNLCWSVEYSNGDKIETYDAEKYTEFFSPLFHSDHWINFIYGPLLSVAIKENVEIEIGTESGTRRGNVMKKYLGIDENGKIIQNEKYPELKILEHIRYPIIWTTKKESVEKLKEIDINLLKFIMDNTVSCNNTDKYMRNKNYCGNCYNCKSMRNTGAYNYANLTSLYEKTS
jgi:7-cyano-7-deazaguanine synthase in queuosine biosynthesis